MAPKLESLRSDPSDRLKQFQIAVVGTLIPMVEEKVGRVYADAVRFCVQQHGLRDLVDDLPRLLKLLDREVVAPLERCYA
jgi:hypothetical protein